MTFMALGWLWWRAWTALVNGDTVALCVAGVALGNICHCFAWQAWHLAASTFVWRGRRGTYGTGLALVARLDCISQQWHRGTLRGRRGTWRLCFRFPWQVWHLATSALFLRGRLGTFGTGLALVARLDWISRRWRPRHFAWQAWHSATFAFVSCGRRGIWQHPPWFCVAGVALMALGWLW